MDGVELKGNYKVTNNSDVILSVSIGDGKVGTHLVQLDFDSVGDGDLGTGLYRDPIKGLTIGKGSDIRTKTLFVTSLVSKTTSEFASVTYELTGGVEPKEFILSTKNSSKKANSFEAEIDLI